MKFIITENQYDKLLLEQRILPTKKVDCEYEYVTGYRPYQWYLNDLSLSKSFEKGMGYVALSRVRSLEGLTLLGLNEIATQVRGEVLDFDEELKEISNKHLAEMHSLSDSDRQERQKKFLQKGSQWYSK